MILVHHLRVGRSVFTVWLLEELGLDYELKIYIRNEQGRAQADLKVAHPLGKSPVIEDQGMVIAESGAIATYLIDTYDTDGLLKPAAGDVAAHVEWTQWLHYSEASAFAPLLLKLLLMREATPHPPLISGFATGEVALHLTYLQDFLGDKEFILGDRLQAPDFGITYICQMAERLGEIAPYPKLKAYLDRQTARPAFQRAVEKTGG
ncbi:glutathione S-transferase family protein [Parvularcula sp. IMCC14364]|uniref:glutathione S-transferase family protein n=1 Tax=Parvularcula sp. IMCC14364 TaxID=3067902 RepID=UPI002740BE0D|nr:glutathione S-transferase family protein [Parvularcula sp. IMCC14364]